MDPLTPPLRRGGRLEEGAATDQDPSKILKRMQDASNLPNSLDGIQGQSLRIYKEVVESREQQKQMFSSEMEPEEKEKVLNTILSDKIYHRPYILPQLENVIKSDERLQSLVFKVIVNILPTNYAQKGFGLNLKLIMEVIKDGVSLENIDILVKKDSTADLSSVLDWIISKIYDQDNVCAEDVAIVTKIIIEANNKERYILQIAEMLKIACFMTSDPVIRNYIMKLTRETLSNEQFLEYNVQPIFERLQALNLGGNDFEAISECVSFGYTIDKDLAGFLIQSLGISEIADKHNLIGGIISEIDERYNLGDFRDILYEKITGDKDLLKIASLWVVIDNGNKQNISMPENMISDMLDVYSSCLDDESLLCPSVVRIIDLIAKTNDIPQAIIDKMMGLVLEDHLSPKIRIYAASIISHKNECSEKIYIEQLKDVANEIDKSDLRYVFLKEMVQKEVKIFIEKVNPKILAFDYISTQSHLFKDINYDTLSSYAKNESPLKIFELFSTINAVVLSGKTINADIFNKFPDDQWRKELLCHAILETMADESTINEIELYKFVDNVNSLEIFAKRYNAEKYSIENILQSFLGKQMKYKLNASKVNELLELLQSGEAALEIIISSRISFLMDLIEIEEIWIEENLKKYDIEHNKENISDLNRNLNCRISILNMFFEKFAQENKIDKIVEFFTLLDKFYSSEAEKEKLLIEMTEDGDIAINDDLVYVLESKIGQSSASDPLRIKKSPDDKPLLQLITEISELNSNEIINVNLAKEYTNVMDSYQKDSLVLRIDKPIKDWAAGDITAWAELIKLHFFRNTLTSESNELILKIDSLKSSAISHNFFQTDLSVSKYEKIAVVKRAIELAIGFSPRDIQLLALLCILSNKNEKGILAQINTGEGKTAIVAMVAAINSLEGRKVDVITTSPTLALPQSQTYKSFFDMLSLKSSSNCSYTDADVLYVDCCEIMGEYVRNRAKENSSSKRKCDIAVVDEVDSMLLDGRNSILKVSSIAPNMDALGSVLAAIWIQVTYVANCLIEENGSTYFVSHENLIDESGNLRKDACDKASLLNTTRREFIRTCTEKHLRKMLRDVDNLESADKIDLDLYPEIKIPNHLRKLVTNFRLMCWIDNAITAKYNYVINRDYVIEGKKIIAVDTSDTGILQYNTKWSGGLHQFLEIKHGAKMSSEDIVSSYISNVSYFKKYERVYGLTGTLGSKSEREMLRRIYEVNDVIIPPFREKHHRMLMPVIVNSESEWYNMILTSCIDKLDKGRGVLLIVDYIDKTEKIATMLKEKNFTESKIRIYAKNENLGVIEKKLGSGEIIIATNIAGRGADIKPTLDVKKNGGLHVCLTFLPKNQRVEYQNVGRTSRTGNPGSSQLIVLDSDECSIRVLRKLRNEKENKEMNVAEAKMKKMVLQDNLLTEYMEIIVDIEDDDEKAAAYERFGIWLEIHKKIIDEEDEKNIMEKFFIFKNAVLADKIKNSLIQNPSFFVRRGNRLLKDKKYDEAILMYNKAIDLDSDFSGNAYYYRGCALIYIYGNDMDSNRAKITSAVEDFKKARDIVDQRMIELNIIQRASDSEVLGEQVKHKMMFLGILRNAIETSVGIDTDLIERDISNLKLQQTEEGKTNEDIEAINKLINDMEIGIKNETGGIIGDALNKNLSLDTELISIIESIPDEYKNDLCRNEMHESESNGFMGCLKLLKEMPIDWKSVAGLAAIGLGQLVAGAAITVFSLGSGSSVGMGFMIEGVGDLITAVKDGIINRDFSWVSWGIQKAISLTVSIACAGMNAIKDAGKTVCAGVKQIGSVVTQTTKQGWKLAAKAIGTSLGKGIALELTNTLVSYGLDKTLMPLIQNVIIKMIEGPIQQALLENEKVMRMLQFDSKNRNKDYETIIKSEARKILNDKGENHPLVQIVHGIGQGILANKINGFSKAMQYFIASQGLLNIVKYVPEFTSKLGSVIEKIANKDEVLKVSEEDEKKKNETKEYAMNEIGGTTCIVEENRSENHLKNHDEIHQNMPTFDTNLKLDTGKLANELAGEVSKDISNIVRRTVINPVESNAVNEIHQNMPEQVTFVTNLKLDTGKLANELAVEVSKDISNIMRRTVINPAVSNAVNNKMKSLNSILDGCIQGEIENYKAKRRVIFSQDSDTRQRIPEDHKGRGREATVEAEKMISDLSNGGEGGMQHLGAISESIASPIKVIDSEGRLLYIIGENRKGNPVKIQYHHDGESGHWTLPGNKEPEVYGAGKYDCLFNVIAEQTGQDSRALRKKAADIMTSKIEIVTSQMADIRRLEKYQKHMLNMGGACYNRNQGARALLDNSEGVVGDHNCPKKKSKNHPEQCTNVKCKQNSGHSRGHAPDPHPGSNPNLKSVEKYSLDTTLLTNNKKSAFLSQKQQETFVDAGLRTNEAEIAFNRLNLKDENGKITCFRTDLTVETAKLDLPKNTQTTGQVWKNGLSENTKYEIQSVVLVLEHQSGKQQDVSAPVHILTSYPNLVPSPNPNPPT